MTISPAAVSYLPLLARRSAMERELAEVVAEWARSCALSGPCATLCEPLQRRGRPLT